jgi:hypothetical protein
MAPVARTFRIFWDRNFDDVQTSLIQGIKARIDNEDQNYLLNVNEADYTAHVVSEFHIAPLVIDFDSVYASFEEKLISADRFPPTFHVFEGKSYPKQVVRFHLPFSGSASLLQCIPSPRVMNTIAVHIEDDAICFELINFYDDPERIKREADSPRWTPENRPYVDTSKAANEVAEVRTRSVIPCDA